MRYRLLFLFALVLAMAQGQAAQIAVSVESLDFGEVEIGYPASMRFTVTGNDLSSDINLTLDGQHTYFYDVTPATISPEAAAAGATVTVKCIPVSEYIRPVNLVLSSPGAREVIIPLTANLFYPEVMFYNNQTEEFTASVGQIVSRKGTIRFYDYEVPTDPTNPPVVMAPGISGPAAIQINPINLNDYSLEIEGPDSWHFSALIVKSSSIANICTVNVSYAPHSTGSHSATLKVYCQKAGVPLITVNLLGECDSVLGDLNGDGLIGISDVVSMIGMLQHADDVPTLGDINCDGVFNITDVTLTICKVLGTE